MIKTLEDIHVLTVLFADYAGQEVATLETEYKPTAEEQEERRNRYVHLSLDPACPTLDSLTKAAAEAGLTARIIPPDYMVTMDYRTDRLNVYLEDTGAGTWRIQCPPSIG